MTLPAQHIETFPDTDPGDIWGRTLTAYGVIAPPPSFRSSTPSPVANPGSRRPAAPSAAGWRLPRPPRD
jgi:hypothetical protein